MAPDIDREIADAFALLAVLLVFEFAFLAYVLSVIGPAESELQSRLDDHKWKTALAKLRFWQRSLIALALSLLGVLITVGRLSGRVLSRWSWPWDPSYVTARGGLILADLFVVTTVVVAAARAIQAHRHISKQTTDRSKFNVTT
jgi:hypothetical protein